jgi:hypothetical protein
VVECLPSKRETLNSDPSGGKGREREKEREKIIRIRGQRDMRGFILFGVVWKGTTLNNVRVLPMNIWRIVEVQRP